MAKGSKASSAKPAASGKSSAMGGKKTGKGMKGC
jgi:hypothetical protein